MAVTATTIVPDLLDEKIYEDWSVYMKNYLLGQRLWSIVEHGIPSSVHLVSPLDKAKNGAALHAIHITCSPPIFAQIRGTGSAKEAWEQLARMMMHQEESSDHNDDEEEEEEESSDHVEEEESITVSRADDAELRRGMWKGEWDVVNQFLQKYPIHTILPDKMGTVLHLAILAGQDEIAEKLVEKMSITDLEIKNPRGNTVLYIATSMNRINVAKCLVQKHPQLLSISGFREFIPTTAAALVGHKEMTLYLYSVTPIELLRLENNDSITYGSLLLCTSISSKMFDISLDLFEQNLNLAVCCTQVEDESPILVLSTQLHTFYSGCRLLFWQQWIYNLIKVKPLNTPIREVGVNNATLRIHDKQKTGIQVIDRLLGATSFIPRFLGIKEIYDLKLSHLYAHQILRCMCNDMLTLNLDQYNEDELFMAALEATKRGTYEIVIELLKVVPTLIFFGDANGRDIFMFAIKYRQEKVFNFFNDNSETWKVYSVIFMVTDKEKNNILHVAGELAPAFQLSRISGEALQMQRELQWFKEVERITPTHFKVAKNGAGLTPREVFTENHKELLKEGEKWMKGTAKSFIIVGALIVTIMFAVAFTVPGGNDQNTGFPIFLGEKSFKIFLISDAISFFAASTSILMFLGILTSRYTEDDFLVSLPTKLIIGLSMLFISTAAMMVSFSATLLIMLRGQLWTIIPILMMASIPITLFIWLQFPLLVRIFVSTYGSGIFGKKVKVEPQ